MATAGNRGNKSVAEVIKMVAMVTGNDMLISGKIAVMYQQIILMPDSHYSERERLVIDLYKNQNKSIRDIAKIAKMSFRDIGYILKKEGLSHGITTIEDNNKKSSNEKATIAYKLFDEGNKPVEVAIQLGLSERQATRYYTEYWRFKWI